MILRRALSSGVLPTEGADLARLSTSTVLVLPSRSKIQARVLYTRTSTSTKWLTNSSMCQLCSSAGEKGRGDSSATEGEGGLSLTRLNLSAGAGTFWKPGRRDGVDQAPFFYFIFCLSRSRICLVL